MPSPYYYFMSLGGMLNKMYQALFFFLSPRPPLKKKKNAWSQITEAQSP